MKRWLWMLLVLLFVTPVTMVAAESTQSSVNLQIDGRQVVTDVPPQMIGGRTMVPLRVIFDALKVSVNWDAKNGVIDAVRGDATLRLTVNSRNGLRNGKSVMFDTAPIVQKGRTLVPTRLVAESFGATVRWSQNDRTVYVGTKSLPLIEITMSDERSIVLELYPEIAPNTVRNMLALAAKGFYDGVIFHRIVPGFVIQGGDPLGLGYGGPGYRIKGEFSANGFNNSLKHTRGVLSMARSSGFDTAGSQFFIVLEDAQFLDGQYTAFGKVRSGMDVVDRIAALPRDDNDRPDTPPVMKKVKVETFGINYGNLETMPE